MVIAIRTQIRVNQMNQISTVTDSIQTTAPVTLQGMLWPERGISTEGKIYFRLTGAAGLSQRQGKIITGPGGKIGFDTAFNLFNYGKFRKFCGIEDILLSLKGRGRFELVVYQAQREKSADRIYNEIFSFDENGAFSVDLNEIIDPQRGGILYFELTSLEEGELRDALWQTRQKPLRQPRIALSITTFKREEAVRESARRFDEFVRTSALAPFLQLIVVDNGQSAEIPNSDKVRVIENENLGGSGGFARGLIEAESLGVTHCLFMDDDAAIHMPVLERVWTFLAYALDENAAVAGGLTMANHRWAMWENGAHFRLSCKPRHLGTDLRDFSQVLKMEHESTVDAATNFYGGWWFFAFPIAAARHRPFPFFVRGDDISFSIANDFNIVTLPGVVCFQDADFSDKESLQTLYLDLRSHVIHHLALPNMEIGRVALLSLPPRFFVRSFLQLHYETLEALNISFEDVMRGPDFFAENADMSARRADLNKIRKDEAWKDLEGPVPAEKIRFNPNSGWVRLLMKLTLNGHLLPFFSHYGNRRVLRAGERGRIRETWAAAQITYLDGSGKYFTVRHSKRKAFRQGWRMARNLFRFNGRMDDLKTQWREGYNRLATDDFWRDRLNLDQPSATAADHRQASAD